MVSTFADRERLLYAAAYTRNATQRQDMVFHTLASLSR